MIGELFGWFTSAPSLELQLAAMSIIGKVTVVLLIAAIASLVLRNASSAIRHRVWLTAIVASVLMPAFAVLPSISVELPSAAYLVQPATSGASAKKVVNSDRSTEPPPRADANGPRKSLSNTPATSSRFRINSGYSSFFPPNQPSVRMYRDRNGSFHYAEPRMVPEQAFGGATVVPKEKKSMNMWNVGFALWIGGSILLLAWRACGYALLARMIKDCKTFSDPAWQHDLEQLTARHGRRTSVRLLQHASLRSPVTAGWMKPVIVLPEAASMMLVHERRAVLAHELAHIERADFVTQAIGSLATSVFWFHPLMWLAASCMRTESECAADDSVLLNGLEAPTYARQLLEMAKQSNGIVANTIPVVAMARASQLERRIRSLLDVSKKRRQGSLRWNRAATVLSAIVVIPIGSARLTSSASEGEREVDQIRETLLTNSIPLNVATSDKTADTVHVNELQLTPQRASVIGVVPVLNSDIDGRDYPELPASRFASDTVVEKSVPMETGEAVDLQILSGAKLVIRGWNEPRAVVRASFAGPSWRQASARLQRTPNGIYIGSVSSREGYRTMPGETGYYYARLATDVAATMPPSADHLIEVWLPNRSNVKLRSVLGPVTIQGFDGDVSGNVEWGDLQIENTTGQNSFSTTLGNIHVNNSNLTGSAATACGTVKLNGVAGAFTATTAFDPEQFNNTMANRIVVDGMFPGDYCNPRLRRLATLPNRIDESQPYGDIVIESAPQGGKLATGRAGSIVVRSSDALISATTNTGNIELRNVRGDATARSNGGEITISLVNTDRIDHFVNVQNANGNVIVELPDSLDATIRAEVITTTPYMERTGVFARMIDQYGLVNGVVPDGDGQIRLSGSTGSWWITKQKGKGSILIRVTDGDIIFRKAKR